MYAKFPAVFNCQRLNGLTSETIRNLSPRNGGVKRVEQRLRTEDFLTSIKLNGKLVPLKVYIGEENLEVHQPLCAKTANRMNMTTCINYACGSTKL